MRKVFAEVLASAKTSPGRSILLPAVLQADLNRLGEKDALRALARRVKSEGLVALSTPAGYAVRLPAKRPPITILEW